MIVLSISSVLRTFFENALGESRHRQRVKQQLILDVMAERQ
jgi:hypothetical protein